MFVLTLVCLILLNMIAWKVGVFVVIADVFVCTVNNVHDWFEAASPWANFCTLFLFLIFVVGKIWILKRNKDLYEDRIDEHIEKEDKDYNRQFLLGGKQIVKISSPEGIYDINVYKIEKWNKTNTKVKKKKVVDKDQEDNIQHPLKLNKNDEVYIKTDLAETLPLFQVEIIKYDYTKIILELAENGKVGGLADNKKVKWGLKSYLYYLCK